MHTSNSVTQTKSSNKTVFCFPKGMVVSLQRRDCLFECFSLASLVFPLFWLTYFLVWLACCAFVSIQDSSLPCGESHKTALFKDFVWKKRREVGGISTISVFKRQCWKTVTDFRISHKDFCQPLLTSLKGIPEGQPCQAIAAKATKS